MYKRQILYKETIAAPVMGYGHFEPLRHYAEVHLRLSPGKPGSGITFESRCSTDVLDQNWQRLIRTHVLEKEHLGVLTGAPLTDVVITLVTGRAHLKHTEGGDFREATYRAIRQGLMSGESVLLEPILSFVIEVDSGDLGRVLFDIQQMCIRDSCTPIGASANIAGIGILRKNGYEVKTRDFIRIGIPFTLAAVIPAYIYFWVLY